VQEEGLKAITNLDHGNAERKRALISLGAPTQILKSLQTHMNNQAVVEEACAAIASIQEGYLDEDINYEQDLGKDFYELGALPIILESMERHMLNADLLVQAISALQTMARVSPERKLKFVQEGVADPLVRAMTKYSGVGAVQEIGCALVSTMSSSHNGVSDELVKAGLDKLVVKAIKDFRTTEDESIQLRGIFAIFNLAYKNKNACKSLKNNDVVKVMKQSIKEFQSNKTIVQKGVSTIALISRNGKP